MNALEARILGEDAYYAGKSETANPFDPSTDEHLSWNDGYLQAQEQDDPEPQG